MGVRTTWWWLIGVTIAALAAASGVVIVHWQHNRAPFALADVRPSVTDVSVVTSQGPLAKNVVQALRDAGTGESIGTIALPHGHQQYVVGRFTMDAHHAPFESQYALFVIDNRTHKPVSLMWPAASEPNNIGAGWDGGLNAIARRFHWLAPLAEPDNANELPPPPDPMGVLWQSGPAEDFAFYAILPRDALPVTKRSDLTIGLAFMGPDRQPWGAMRLY